MDECQVTNESLLTEDNINEMILHNMDQYEKQFRRQGERFNNLFYTRL